MLVTLVNTQCTICFLQKQNKLKDLSYILDKVWKSVQGWKSSFFSIVGKEILIKSIGQVISSYVMSVFRFPKNLCEDITRSFARIWWGSSSNKKKMHWFKWDSLCLPKSLGGLNFRDIEGCNKALIAKQVWRIMSNPNDLVSRFLKSLYYNNSNILEAELGRSPSFLWKSLIWGRELLTKGHRYRIGDFKPICINGEMINKKVGDFITPTGVWDLEELKRAVISFDCHTIRGIPINLNLRDKLICHYDRIGKYTVKVVTIFS